MTFATAAFAPCFLTRPSGRTFTGKSRNAYHLALSDSSVFQYASNSVQGTSLSSVAIAGDSAQVFEPIVNVPALGSFLFIAIVFSFLILRVRQVENAVERRKAALTELRQVKSQELSGGVSESAVAKALKEYEDALNSEEDARVIIPGVRVVAPNQPAARNEEDVAAARQFLGIDLSDESSASASSKKEKERTGLSTGSVAVLAVVALSQIALLYMLSFDPMDTFNTLGGSSPPDLPPSSWQ